MLGLVSTPHSDRGSAASSSKHHVLNRVTMRPVQQLEKITEESGSKKCVIVRNWIKYAEDRDDLQVLVNAALSLSGFQNRENYLIRLLTNFIFIL